MKLRARALLLWTDAPGIVRLGIALAFVFLVLLLF